MISTTYVPFADFADVEKLNVSSPLLLVVPVAFDFTPLGDVTVAST